MRTAGRHLIVLILGLLLHAIFFVFGLIWCQQILKRFPQDVAEFREGSATERTVISVFWALTAVIGFYVADFVIGFIPSAAI